MEFQAKHWLCLSLVFLIVEESSTLLQKVERKKYLAWDKIDYDVLMEVTKDVLLNLPTLPTALCLDLNVDINFPHNLTKTLHSLGVKTTLYMINSEKDFEKIKADVRVWLRKYESANYLFLFRKHLLERILQEIKDYNLIQRNLFYIFFWLKNELTLHFRIDTIEPVKLLVITHPRPNFFQMHYTQAATRRHERHLHLINWWTPHSRLFRNPLLPPISKAYHRLMGRIFRCPVVHKPPWFFVSYQNDTEMIVEGGRDFTLLKILEDALEFTCEFMDPPDRSQGSAAINGSMQGALGLVASRVSFNRIFFAERGAPKILPTRCMSSAHAHLFTGDLTITYERSQFVEFSFLTLVDSELFLTHSPGYLNEALALIRPFHWMVWPAILVTLLMAVPVLFLFMSWVNSISRVRKSKSKIFGDCVWMTSTIFLQQAIRFKPKDQRMRFIIVVLSLSLTYVIGDMYSANLTSLFARPSKERPISTLEDLYDAMKNDQYQVLIEENSASHSILENGTGINRKIWNLMIKQPNYFVDSIETGMKLIRDRKKFAIIGGRETFYYDTHRFGAENFHLSQRLSTRYSAIAFQTGSPYIETINMALMRLFEGGIYTKITEDEYQKLRQNQIGITVPETKVVSEGTNDIEESDTRLKAMSMKTLQGAFYVLIIGHLLSGVVFMGEQCCYAKRRRNEKKAIKKWRILQTITNWIYYVLLRSSDHR